MQTSLASIRAFTAAQQAARSSPIPKAVGSAPCGSTHRHKPGTDPAACPILFIANPPLAKGAGGGLLGAIRAKSPSVISVTYGVVLRMLERVQNQKLNPVDSSERHEFWFRKARILVPKGTNCGSGICEQLGPEKWFPIARMEVPAWLPRAAVPDSTNFGSR
jgi:hypothetical protein